MRSEFEGAWQRGCRSARLVRERIGHLLWNWHSGNNARRQRRVRATDRECSKHKGARRARRQCDEDKDSGRSPDTAGKPRSLLHVEITFANVGALHGHVGEAGTR